MWTLSIRPQADSGLAAVDVVVRAHPRATVGDLATALGHHLAPFREGPPPAQFRQGPPQAPSRQGLLPAPSRAGLLLAPSRDGTRWPAAQLLMECGLRSGDLVDVSVVPGTWLEQPGPVVRPRATLRVLAGPDAGREVALVGEAATIGRSPMCTVSLTDPLVSRRHARLLLRQRPLIADDGSAHGTVVAGSLATRPTPVDFGTPITVGDSVLVLEAAGPESGLGTGVLRPPRFGEPLADETVEVAAPPAKPRPAPPPWLMMLMPLMMGAAMLAAWRSFYILIYLIGYPVLMFGGYLEQRRRANKEHRESLRLWYQDLRHVLDRLDHHATAQRERAAADHPDLAEVPRRVVARHPTLWTRHRPDPEFLACRVGLGPVPARLHGLLREGGDREARAKALPELARRRILGELPVLLPLGSAPVVALVGQSEQVDGLTRALVLRLCADHSPADVSLAAVLSPARRSHESWLRWLPHGNRRIGGLAPVTVGAADGAALLDRLAADDAQGVTVCLIDSGAGVSRRQIEAVARVAGERLRLVWLGDDPATVPAATEVVVDLTLTVPAAFARADAAAAELSPDAAAVVARRDRAGAELVSTVDSVTLAEAWRTARAMTAYTDEVALIPAETALPRVARLPELVGDLDDPDSADAVLARWAARRGLRAAIGAGIDGVMTIDLREDGPHGLVAGTTGAGKSELLQTLIVSLALSNPPDRICFLLVDYKGGAAFRECADLPHTAGYITDLSPALVARALTSLYAEVSAREELLARFGAKDLAALEKSQPDAAPPSLLICVDEFAALTAEVPDFVDGMVNIAQRGRSLGMHLILATQRPAGVITPNIRANTDLRIALRVASTDDSQDVIDRPDAAAISRRTPGRAWIRRTGHGTDDLIQVAWSGARESVASARPIVEITAFSACETAGIEETPAGLHPQTDLERLVSTIGRAFARSGRKAAPRPWLPPLPAVVDLHTILQSGQIVVGLVDQPGRRAQPPLVLDYPQCGHVLVYGTSGSGKTELLRTVAAAAGLAGADPLPQIYGIDFGGGGLAGLSAWPGVGSIVGEQDIGRVLRLLRVLRRTVAARNAILAAADSETWFPRIHVLIDNLPALVEALEGNAIRRQHADLLTAVLTDGRRACVHLTATAPHRGGIPTPVQAAFGERLVLRMTSGDDYAVLGVPGNLVTADSPPGRGIAGRHEFQAANSKTLPQGVCGPRPAAIKAMPSRVSHTEFPPPHRDNLVIGVESEFLDPVTVSLTDGPLVIAGRSRGGRTGLLAGLAAQARRAQLPPAEIVLAGPRANAAPGAYDTVLSEPEQVVTWLKALRGSPPEWRLLLVDDAHLWERDWDFGGPARDAVNALAAAIDEAKALGLAVAVATDTDEARSRQHVPGMVTAARRGRCGILLAPDFADGSLLSVMVPGQASESLTGAGRGLFCANGSVQVVQVVGVQEGAQP